MSEVLFKYPEWEKPLQEFILEQRVPDLEGRAAGLRVLLRTRLQAMKPSDGDEFQALKDAVHILDVLEDSPPNVQVT